MRWDPEQHMVIVRTVDAWAEQARAALAEIEAANGGPVAHIEDAATFAPDAFGRLVEALVALEPLGAFVVDDHLVQLARLRPVDEVISGGE